jgi:hypothetical protein
MRKRLISLALALIYFSVTIAFSRPHFHNESRSLSHQCAACAWHFESCTDAPAGPSFIRVPVIIVQAAEAPELRLVSATPVTHADRGPPSLS